MTRRVVGMLAGLRTASGRAKARYALSWRVNRVLYPLGLAVLSDYFYQPLPSRRALREHQQLDLPAVRDTLETQRELVTALLEEHAKETGERFAAWGYRREGAQLSAGDAEVLYAMVRHFRPRRVVEIGSGSSTLVIAAALDRNAHDGGDAELTSIDPFVVPPVASQPHPRVRYQHLALPLQRTDPSVWSGLEAGDVLFVDSSHVFKRGSDVEYQFLHLYPLLRAGVIVHVHDVFYPLDYPLEWNVGRSQFWNEQHLLAAVLQNSTRYEVIACLSALHRAYPGLLPGLLEDLPPAVRPGSIWLRVGSGP